MSDLISREELKQKFQWLAKATKYGNEDAEQQNFSYSTMMMYEIADMIEDAIDSCESVEPERKPGKWEWDRRAGEYVCSECGCNPIYERTTPDCSEIDKYKFCRWCGAEMKGEHT